VRAASEAKIFVMRCCQYAPCCSNNLLLVAALLATPRSTLSFGIMGAEGVLSLVWLHDAADTCESETPTREIQGGKIWLEQVPDKDLNVTFFDTDS